MNFQFKVKCNEKIKQNNDKEKHDSNKENINKLCILIESNAKPKQKESQSFLSLVNNAKDIPNNNIKITHLFISKKITSINDNKDISNSHKYKVSLFNSNAYLINSPFSMKQIPFEYIQDIWSELNNESLSGTDLCSFDFIQAQSNLNAQMRSILIDWIQNIHFYFKMKEETLFLCINIIDRYLSKKYVVKEKLQLIGVSSLYIASKYEEIYYPNTAFFSEATDNAFSAKEIVEYEYNILTALNFVLTLPLPTEFYNIISLNFNMTNTEYYFGLFLLELFLLDINYTKHSSLILAQSAAYLALKNYRKNEALSLLKTTASSDVKLCSNCIISWAKDIGNHSYRVILIKFLQENFMKISEMYIEKDKKN